MRYPLIAGLACAALLASVTAASAQTPAVPGSVPGDAAATPETAAAKQKPKPKRKGPPSSVTVINATASPVTGVVITAGDKTTTLSKPLAPKGRATVRLPKMKGCTVSVAATFKAAARAMPRPSTSARKSRSALRIEPSSREGLSRYAALRLVADSLPVRRS